MDNTIQIHKPKPETHLPVFEQEARARRAGTIATPTLPGTRQPFKRRVNAPLVRHTSTPKPKPQA